MFGLLGRRLSHSHSPLIHAQFGDYPYRLYPKEPEELAPFLRHGEFSGLNVTIPYKEAVIPFCASLSETARTVGSVNTLLRRPDRSLHGDNTDCFGFAYLLDRAGIDPAGQKALVLGSGGSSRTVAAVLRNRGAGEIVVVSRQGPDNYQNIGRHRDAALIVNATPVGIYPNNGLSPLEDLRIFENCRAVIDLIYNPSQTELLFQAQMCGMTAVNGLAMLTAQAKKSAEIFTGTSIPDRAIEAATEKIARSVANIVLIGLPGCGKTSVGAALAKRTERAFADTDEWVANAAQKPVPDIFAQEGEDAFRALETAALQALCKQSGLVVATGGGAVTRPENRRILRQNGVVVFLDRELDLLPLTGRPLSQKNGIAALAAQRLPLYRQWADYTVPVRGVEETALAVQMLLMGETT